MPVDGAQRTGYSLSAMEARDSGSKIRPLPIDDIGGDAPQHQPIEPRRRLAPLIVIVAGAIAFGVIARGLGVGAPTDLGAATTAPPANLAEEPGPTTTTTPPPPPPKTLRQMLPVVGDDMKLVALSATTAKIGHWHDDLTFPSFEANISQPRSAEYNADGTRVAIHTWVRQGSFVVATAAGYTPAYIQQNVTSGAWHATEPDLFAWTEADDESASTTVRVADVSGDTSTGVAALIEFSLPAADYILHDWGDWGFAVTSGAATHGLDADGIETRTATGSFFDAAADGTLLLATMDGEGSAPFLLNPDGSQTELLNLDIGASDFRITSDGGWVLATTIQEDGHTSILARTVRSRSTRLTSIDETARVVSMAWDDRLLVLQELDSHALVFKDWNTGAEYRVATDEVIGAVDLGDGFRLGE